MLGVLKSNPEAIRRLRKAKGHSTLTLAEESTVSQQRISDLEKEPTVVRSMTAKRLADALGVQITDIATVHPDDEPSEVAS